jgi:hypothetical protein
MFSWVDIDVRSRLPCRQLGSINRGGAECDAPSIAWDQIGDLDGCKRRRAEESAIRPGIPAPALVRVDGDRPNLLQRQLALQLLRKPLI